jgi:hypothetical protein
VNFFLIELINTPARMAPLSGWNVRLNRRKSFSHGHLTQGGCRLLYPRKLTAFVKNLSHGFFPLRAGHLISDL